MTDKYIVTTKELAEIMNVTTRWINELHKRGMPRKDYNKWYIPDIFQYFTQSRSQNASTDLNEQRRLLYAAQTERETLQNAARKKELIEIEDVTHFVNGLVATFAGQLESIGPRLANELVGENEAGIIKNKIDDEARHIRKAIYNILETWEFTEDHKKDNPSPTR